MGSGDTIPIQVFSTGTHAGMEWRERDLDQMVANHTKLAQFVKPPVRLEKNVIAEQADGAPAAGWISRLRRVGNTIVADLTGVPTLLREVIRQGRYTKVEANVYPRWEETTWASNIASGAQGRVLSGITLLGADVPEVRKLEDLGLYVNGERPMQFGARSADMVTCAFECAPPKETKTVRTNTRPKCAEATVADLEAEVKKMGEDLDALQAAQRRIAERADRLNLTAFAPSRADQEDDGVGYDAHAFLAAVEGRLQLRGWNRDNPADRRRAAQEVLVEWQREHPEAIPDPEDYRRVIDGFVPSGGNESRPDLLAPKPGVAHPVQASESGNGPAPYGTAATREAERLGGVDLWHRLRKIAREKRLDLKRPPDRELAEQLLYQEEGKCAAHARSFDEALHAVIRDQRLTFAEEDRQKAALQVAKIRPDLCGDQYRAGRDEPAPPRKPRPDDDETLKLVEAAAKQLCLDEDVPLTEANVQKAKVAVARLHPEVAPDYGRPRKK